MAQKPSKTQTAKMGEPAVDLDRALQVAAALEDDDLVRKMRLDKWARRCQRLGLQVS